MLRRTPALLLLSLALVGCGAGEQAAEPVQPAGAQPPADGPLHVHGLGVDAADGALYIATHTGLWRAGADEARAERVGESRQDLMGFTVAAPGRFVASGHPDPATDDPPQLGLIESTDGGRSWRSLSLRGEADFHTLRIAGNRLYGADATTGRLLASSDGGRTWGELRPPGPLVDLAVNPRDEDHVVAATEEGLFASRDGGRRWRPAARTPGLLVWPAADRLVVVDGSGAVAVSADAGRSLEPVGDVGGQPSAFARHEDELLVALHDGTVKRSRDGGRTWDVRVAAPAAP